MTTWSSPSTTGPPSGSSSRPRGRRRRRVERVDIVHAGQLPLPGTRGDVLGRVPDAAALCRARTRGSADRPGGGGRLRGAAAGRGGVGGRGGRRGRGRRQPRRRAGDGERQGGRPRAVDAHHPHSLAGAPADRARGCQGRGRLHHDHDGAGGRTGRPAAGAGARHRRRPAHGQPGPDRRAGLPQHPGQPVGPGRVAARGAALRGSPAVPVAAPLGAPGSRQRLRLAHRVGRPVHGLRLPPGDPHHPGVLRPFRTWSARPSSSSTTAAPRPVGRSTPPVSGA